MRARRSRVRGCQAGVVPSPYSDLSRPPLRAGALAEALLAPAGPFARLEVLQSVGSTNAELAARAAEDRDGSAWPHLSVITADHQSAGRGRLGRTWGAPPRSSLAVSVLLRPSAVEVPVDRWSWLPLLAGLSAVSTLRRVAGVAAELKWPNDVLVDGRKVAGVLAEVVPATAGSAGAAEVVPATSAPAGVVVGVGLNVSVTAAELPVPTATSLALLGAASTDRDVLLRALLRTLADDVARWTAARGSAVDSGLAARVREVCGTLGREVSVELPGGGAVAGTAEGLDDDGRLLVRRPPGASPAPRGGELVAVHAGDVVHLR